MTDATLLTDRARPTVRLERRLADPPATVWQALTERDQLRAWFPCDVVVAGGEWRVGASIEFPFDDMDLTLTGRVLAVDVPRVLEYTWGEETLRFELTADGAGTLLVLTDELPASAAARNAAGWDFCLDRLGRPRTPRRPVADALRRLRVVVRAPRRSPGGPTFRRGRALRRARRFGAVATRRGRS